MRLCPSVGVCVGQLEVSLRVRLSGFVSVGLLYVSLCPSRLFRVRVSLRPRVLTHPRVPAYVSPRVAASPRVFPAPLRVPAAPPQRSPPACPRASPRRRPSTCPQLRAVRMRGWVGAAPSRTCAVRKGGGGRGRSAHALSKGGVEAAPRVRSDARRSARRSPHGRRRRRERCRTQTGPNGAASAHRHPRRHLPLRRGAGVLPAAPAAALPGTAAASSGPSAPGPRPTLRPPPVLGAAPPCGAPRCH